MKKLFCLLMIIIITSTTFVSCNSDGMEANQPITKLENLALTDSQKKTITDMLNGLVEAGITYSFESFSEIRPSDFPTYFSTRAANYFTVTMDKEMKMTLNDNQISSILQGDFDLTTLPSNYKNMTAVVQFGQQGLGFVENSSVMKNKIIKVNVNICNNLTLNEVNDRLEFVRYNIIYTFEVGKDQKIHIKSGKIVV